MKAHLFGDSVFEGSVTDLIDDPAPALDELRTPAAIMNLAAGRPFAALTGRTRIPKQVKEAERELTARVDAGAIAAGDAIVFLDVGPHAMDTRRHEEQWLRLRRAAVGRHAVRLIMCSGFDHGARGRAQYLHEAPLDGRSPNDAVRAAALREGDFVGSTEFLDLAQALRRLHKSLKARFGLSPYFRDCVHLNGWGQIGLSLLILVALGVPARGMGRLAQRVAANGRRLGARSAVEALEVLQVIASTVGAPVRPVRRRLAMARLWRSVRRAWRGVFGRPAPAPAGPDPELAALLDRAAALADPDEALALYRQAAALQPDCAAAHQGRVHAAALAGRPAEVIDAGRAALGLDPVGGKYYVWIAAAMLQERSPPALVAWLDALAEEHAPPRAFTAMAELVGALGDPARARVWAARVAALPQKARR